MGKHGPKPRRERIDEERHVPRNRERRRPETVSIEYFLGVYRPREKCIVLYVRGFHWCCQNYGFDPEWLRHVVIIHEIAHWIMHCLPKAGVPLWKTELYEMCSRNLHEGWAQLMTWWIAKQVGGNFLDTFKELNKDQSPPYRVFKDFTDYAEDEVMESLDRLRFLAWPATVRDWERTLQ